MGIRGYGRSSGRSAGRQSRWLLLAAFVLAWAGLIGGVRAGDGEGGLREADAETAVAAPEEDEEVSPLSEGAPSGVVTLPAAPVRVDEPQPATPVVISGLAENGIPNVALNAYRVAATRMNSSKPGCGIEWSLLAAIGRVESNHGRYGGAVLNPDGTSTPEIRGPALDGGKFAHISDSDGGRFDRDTQYDRAVGPMQFIPTTWRSYAVDGDGDGVSNPFDIDDAALASANYLCTAGGDLRTAVGQRRAVFAYNHSDEYVAQVLALARAYGSGVPVDSLPLRGDTTSPVPPPTGNYRLPAAPGPAIGASDRTPASGDTVPVQTGGAAPPPAGEPAPPPGGPPPAAAPPAGGSSQQGSGGGSPPPAPPPAQGAQPAPPAPAPSPLPVPLPAPLPPPPAAPANPLPSLQDPPPLPPPPAPVANLVEGVTCNVAGNLLPDLPGLPECPR
ncbi:lytic transglycosylase domain-containing protein [Blastococcus sp. CCUG 61487]|uniref:lytic transglycosylase domain-containing protein n=1 Tax=Blastococcus sp. CCUG 61487 TaxID=1840703 RepID=UPI0010C14D3A|nr:lytic transglycosylase domain-containing protein [Blastococcus sp. CCUG 61487]TKJ18721.1 hypothetical protein A6V29_11205 [Blastococcus sp. CCUG 61487]